MAKSSPVNVRPVFSDLPMPLRTVALRMLDRKGFRPVHAHLWRVTPIRGGFELDCRERPVPSPALKPPTLPRSKSIAG